MATMSEISVDCKVAPRLAMAAAVVVHILLFLAIRFEMQPQARESTWIHPARDVPLEVRFIEPTVRRKAVPSEVVQAPSAPASATRLGAPSRTKPKAVPLTEASVPSSRFDAVPVTRPGAADALAALPVSATPAAPAMAPAEVAPAVVAPDYVPVKPADSAGIMSHREIVGYTKSRFDDAWAPRDETVVSQGLRRAQEAATIRKTVDFGHGVRMHCAVGPLGGGCGFGDAPSKAAAKDGDTRLSMAPARSLANDMPDASAPRGEATCVAAYRADARVAQGCPSDTPLKAMDVENAERIRRAGL